MLAKIVQFNTGTGTTAIPVTSVGFTPKVVIFFGTNATGNGTQKNSGMGFGFMVSATKRGYICYGIRDTADGGAATRGRVSNTRCFGLVLATVAGGGGTLDFTSLDVDGFTVTPSTAFAASYVVNALCLGGSDLTNVDVTSAAISAANGAPQSITGLSFQPDCVIALGALQLIAADTVTVGAGASIGFAAAGITQASAGTEDNTPSDFYSELRTDRLLTLPRDDSTAERINLNLTSFNSDGITFTVNRSAGAEQPLVIFLFLKGGNYKVGNFAAHTGTGNFSKTGVGFVPVALLGLSTFLTTTTQTTTGNNASSLSVGAATTPSNRAALGAAMQTNNTGACQTRQDNGKFMYHNTYSSGFIDGGSQDLVSMDNDGFTLNQVVADAAANLELFLAFGPGVSSGLSGGVLAALESEP